MIALPERRYCSYCGAAFVSAIDKCPRDGADLYSAAWDPLLGQILGGRYRLVESLGGGGMGEVYRAVHLTIDKSFAVKVMLGEVAADRGMVERFHREARSLSRLSHRNIVTVNDFGQTERGLLYLVTEFVGGRSLASEIERGPFTERRAADVVRQVARALAHAHQRGVVHRDLKADNVLLVAEDVDSEVAKVLDFGIARVIGEEGPGARHHLTTAGLVIGTPAYMSPEQARGEPADARADLYSLGVMLYELLAGTLPFTGGSPVELLSQHLTAAPPPIRRLDVSPALSAVAMRLLEKLPARRFADAGEVVRAIDEVERTGLAVRPTAPQWAATPPADVAEAAGAEPTPATSAAGGEPSPGPPLVVVDAMLVEPEAAAPLPAPMRPPVSKPSPAPVPTPMPSPMPSPPSEPMAEMASAPMMASASEPMMQEPAAVADLASAEPALVMPARTTTPHPAPPAPQPPAGATLLGMGPPSVLPSGLVPGATPMPVRPHASATPWPQMAPQPPPGAPLHPRPRTETGEVFPARGSRALRYAAAGAVTGLAIGLIMVFAGNDDHAAAAGDAGAPAVAAVTAPRAADAGARATVPVAAAAADAGARTGTAIAVTAPPPVVPDAGARTGTPIVVTAPPPLLDAGARTGTPIVVTAPPPSVPDAGARTGAPIVVTAPPPLPPPDAGARTGARTGTPAAGESHVDPAAVPTPAQLRRRLERAGQKLDDLAHRGREVGALRRRWLDLVGELAALDAAPSSRTAFDRRVRKLETAIRGVR